MKYATWRTEVKGKKGKRYHCVLFLPKGSRAIVNEMDREMFRQFHGKRELGYDCQQVLEITGTDREGICIVERIRAKRHVRREVSNG